MKKEFEQKLFTECPNLFSDRSKTLMRFGFPNGDGWFDLIYKASKKIEAIVSQMPIEERNNYRAFQIKEKFGSLRFYMSTQNEEIDNIIREVEQESIKTCQQCGKSGEFVTINGWRQVLCSNCEKEKRK